MWTKTKRRWITANVAFCPSKRNHKPQSFCKRRPGPSGDWTQVPTGQAMWSTARLGYPVALPPLRSFELRMTCLWAACGLGTSMGAIRTSQRLRPPGSPWTTLGLLSVHSHAPYHPSYYPLSKTARPGCRRLRIAAGTPYVATVVSVAPAGIRSTGFAWDQTLHAQAGCKILGGLRRSDSTPTHRERQPRPLAYPRDTRLPRYPTP